MTHASLDPSPGRSRGSIRIARSLWYTAPQTTELRSERLAPTPPASVTVETHYSAISRGTERLIWAGNISSTEWQRMRAPFQEGDFPFPVKYGYSAAGVVVDGPSDWIGAHTFALHPHQDIFTLPVDRVTRLPDGLPLKRATLAANMETALNALWDSGAGPGDRIVVVGAGIVGLLVTYLATRLPGAQVTTVDVVTERQALVQSMGATFASTGDATGDSTGEIIGDNADVVFHTSAHADGLATAISACGFEATLVEMSWYGDRDINVNLGGAFHSKRLRLVSSQVGHVAVNRRPRWSHTRRLETAVGLLDSVILDELVDNIVPFDDLPQRLPDIFDGSSGGRKSDGLAPVVAYPAAT